MKPKTMVLILLAVVCGLGASYMTSRLLSDKKDSEDTIKVLVAKKKLDTGQRIKNPEEWFEFKDLAKGVPAPDAIVKFDDLKDRVLRIPRGQGEWITNNELVDKERIGVDPPPGYRAVGVKVNPESIAGGWASLPHCRVDIMHNVRRGDDKSTGTQILLQNVLVLGIDDKDKRVEDGRPMTGAVIILALTPEDAEIIDVARSIGTLSLMLRPNGDDQPIKKNRKVTAEEVYNNSGHPGDDAGSTGADSAKLAMNNPAAGLSNLDIPGNREPMSAPPESKDDTFRQSIIYPDRVEERFLILDKRGSWKEVPPPNSEGDDDQPPQVAPASPRPTPATPTPAPKKSAKSIGQ